MNLNIRHHQERRSITRLLLAICFVIGGVSCYAAQGANEVLVRQLGKFLEPVLHDLPVFTYEVRADVQAPSPLNEPRVEHGRSKEVKPVFVRFSRLGKHEWTLLIRSSWHNVQLVRRHAETILRLPDSGLQFLGKGFLTSETDSLEPAGFCQRFITPETSLSGFMALLFPSTIDTVLKTLLLPTLSAVPPGIASASELTWKFKGDGTLTIGRDGPPRLKIDLTRGKKEIHGFGFFEVSLTASPTSIDGFASDSTSLTSEVPRDELEKMIFRGLRRILSLKFPGPTVHLSVEPRLVPHGEMRELSGHPVVLLSGTPEEIGMAHGKLLGVNFRQTVDSTIYLVGLVETISKGKWFLRELEEAWSRLSPHIPSDHLRELGALASACPTLTLKEAQLSNIFPEYFHCSGFATFGKATEGGVLYHGRVLDYMTEIGLQQSAVTFVVKPKGKLAFLNVGFAGFIGSVSGMNEKQIGLGEMGGGGRYQWDGIPMSILMRRAMEECETLDQVKKLWKTGPRTCEYYYVFSDGKIPSAVGVRATPAEIEFLDPGVSHPKVGNGIPDTVVLSAGKRLNALRERIEGVHGKVNVASALKLMDRPVAMRSNLHNVLFVPQKLEAFVAVATDHEPAADQPYVRIPFGDLLKSMP